MSACPKCSSDAIICTGRNGHGRPTFSCGCGHRWAAERHQSDRLIAVARQHHAAINIPLPIVQERA